MIRENFRSYLFRVPTGVWIALVLETIFLLLLAATDGYDVARHGEVWRVVLTYLLVLAMFGGLHLLVGTRRGLSEWLTFGLILAFIFVNVSQEITSGAFDYGFVHDNLPNAFSPAGRHIVGADIKPGEYALLALLPIGCAVLLRRRPSPPLSLPLHVRLVGIAACAALVIGLTAARVSTHETMTSFAASAIRYHTMRRATAVTLEGERYPYRATFEPSVRARDAAHSAAPRPHIIVLFLESWNGLYVGKKGDDGSAYTPVFDHHASAHLSVDTFYGNSVQTCRGHFATLCSLMPMYRGKEFTDLGDTRLHCLPDVLGEAGYKTLFYSATDEPEFDNAQRFLTHIGFSESTFQPPTARVPGEFWGTGVQDDLFYDRFFDHLDTQLKNADRRPLFAVAANTSHHYPFRSNPKHVAANHGNTTFQRNYVGSLRSADAWLEAFFRALEARPAFRDALVVLVGDHSYPADEHGIHYNQLGAYEEAFRTAFMLRWPGHVPPTRLRERTYSQIDIAPTITDLLQLRHPTHFVGRSLFADPGPKAPVPLVQPYDGVHLVAVDYPYKHVRHDSAEQEHLYNLAADPLEKNDLISDPSFANILSPLRQTIERIRANQELLQQNRIWPTPTLGSAAP